MVGKGVKQGVPFSLPTNYGSTSDTPLYAGGFIHVDDIRALSSSTEFLEKQISIVENFLEGKPFEIERPKDSVRLFISVWLLPLLIKSL